MDNLGERFAHALAAKDAHALLGVLHDDVDFRALTPRRAWEATSAREVVDDVLLGQWFKASDRIDALEDVATGSLADRGRLSYRFRVTKDDGTYVIEQQAYYGVAGERIDWLRILCSGYRPIEEDS